jgi:hypothetical protein
VALSTGSFKQIASSAGTGIAARRRPDLPSVLGTSSTQSEGKKFLGLRENPTRGKLHLIIGRIVDLQNARIAHFSFVFRASFFVVLSLSYDILNIPRTHNYQGWPICDARGDDLLRTCMGAKVGGCATYMEIEQGNDGPVAIARNATLIGFWRELGLEPIDK